MSKPSKQEGAALQFDSGRAGLVSVEHTVRTMKFYNVAEHEMDSLSLLNDLQSIGAAAGTLFLSLGIPDAISAAFPPASGPAGDWRRATVFIVLAGVSFVASYVFRRKAAKVWSKIGIETQSPTKPGA